MNSTFEVFIARMLVYSLRAVRWCLGKGGPIVLYDDLTPDHFHKYPIWLYIHEHDFGNWMFELEDEESMRPWNGKYPAPTTFIGLIRTKFTAANGQTFEGVVQHSEYENNERPWILRLSPELFLSNGESISFLAGRIQQRDDPALKEVCRQFYSTTGLTSETAFPMSYAVAKGILQESISGTIPGIFYFTEDDEMGFTK